MGHIVNSDREYRLLQQKLDKNVTGAPDSPVLLEILKLLFSPSEVELARRVPCKPTSLNSLSRKTGMDAAELGARLTELAERGLMLDFERSGKRYFMLPPVVIGLFEFTFMRARDNVPMAELARLFDEYMHQDDQFAHTIFQKETQIGRALVREEALPADDPSEVLDWERATKLIETASAVSVSLCSCRHKASHLDKACDAPQDVCLSLNMGAVALSKSGNSRMISNAEGMRILEECKSHGLVQVGDNVQRSASYICNCCGCCCGMLNAIRHFDIRNAVVTSNWILDINADKCVGCGLCAKKCPIDAIAMKQEDSGRAKVAVCDQGLCLGCGVCYSSCKKGALAMKPREKRVLTPEDTFERIVRMAIERAKLADLIFDDPENLGYRAIGRVLSILEKTSPVRALMAVEPLKSKFIGALLKKRPTGI